MSSWYTDLPNLESITSEGMGMSFLFPRSVILTSMILLLNKKQIFLILKQFVYLWHSGELKPNQLLVPKRKNLLIDVSSTLASRVQYNPKIWENWIGCDYSIIYIL